jgi:5-methylcytosine-specific restriction endonuclease McrA
MPKPPERFRPKGSVQRQKQSGSEGIRVKGWERTRRRQRILVRDACTCRGCRQAFPESELIVDHREPLSERQQDDDEDNLQLLCHKCDKVKQGIENARRFKKPEDFYLSLLLSHVRTIKDTKAVPVSDGLRSLAEQRYLEDLDTYGGDNAYSSCGTDD